MAEHGHVLLATLTVEGLRLTLANKHCFPEIPGDILERAPHEADQPMDLGPVFEAHDEFEAVVVRYLAENHPELRKPWTGKPDMKPRPVSCPAFPFCLKSSSP